MHLRESRTSKFSRGACPRTPQGLKALWVFGKYTSLLLLSTHLCKNLLKSLTWSMHCLDVGHATLVVKNKIASLL